MNDRFDGQSFYDLLEIPPTAGVQEVYKAYQKVKAAYSPSSPALYTMFTPKEAQDLLAMVEEAFQILSHQARRKEYDLQHGFAAATTAPAPTQYGDPTTNTPIAPTPSSAEKAWVGQVKVSKKEELSNGFARTKLSTYEVKPEIEAEIKAMAECDGAFIQKIRLYRGVALDRLADEMRVTKTTLAALEANNIGALPVAVFTRGLVVQIARFLCLEEKPLVDAYMKYFKAKKLG